MRTIRQPNMRFVVRLITLIASMQFSASAMANSYLSELEAEAETLGGGAATTKNAPAANANWKITKQPTSDNLKQGMTQVEFTATLRDSYYGSYIFFSKLNAVEQHLVYESYKKNNNIEAIRDEIKKRITK